MKITNVTVNLLKGDYRVRAFAAFTIDDDFVVHGAKVIDGNKGLFVAMPQETNYNEETGEKEFLDICHPINTETRNKITKAVLDAYWDLLDKENNNDERYSE